MSVLWIFNHVRMNSIDCLRCVMLFDGLHFMSYKLYRCSEPLFHFHIYIYIYIYTLICIPVDALKISEDVQRSAVIGDVFMSL